MGTDTERLRIEIEETREDLGRDVDALSEKVDPRRVAHRRVDDARDAARRMRDAVVGAGDSGRDRMSDLAGSAQEHVSGTAHSMTDEATRRTRGNPLALGLVAFGVGWLVASIVPAPRGEQELVAAGAERVQSLAEPVANHLRESAENVKEAMSPQVSAAAQDLKDSASQGVQRVRGETQGQVQDMRSQHQG